jgi:SAM-dependent methyltransferase
MGCHVDSYWQEVSDFLNGRATESAKFAAPNTFQESLSGVIPISKVAEHEIEDLAGLVIHKGLFKEIDPTFLYQYLQQAVPTFANPVFIVVEKHGARALRRREHLGQLPEMREWASLHADAAVKRSSEGAAQEGQEANAAVFTAMVDFIVERLAKVIDPSAPEPVIAIGETAERFNDTEWFWVDDTAKSAELFAVPRVRDAHPALADALIDYILRLSPKQLLHRRSAVPELKLKSSDPKNFAAFNSFFNLTGDLTQGMVCHSVRYNDDRTRVVAPYTGNVVWFTYQGRRHSVDIETTIKRWSIEEKGERIDFSHTSVIDGPGLPGPEKHLCDVTYRYTLWRHRPTVELAVTVSVAPDTDLEDVQITTAFDQISVGGGCEIATVGLAGEFSSVPAPDTSPAAIHVGPADYLCLYEAEVIPGFANAAHVRFRDASRIRDIVAEGSNRGFYHWVYPRYLLGDLGSEEAGTVVEDRLMTGGGYYDQPRIYHDLMAADAGGGTIDPSVSYDVGAELNAIAVTLLFARQGLYSASPPDEARLIALKAWYDRHLEVYLQVIRPTGQAKERRRVFVRGLSFVILSLDCMVRAYGGADYAEKLQSCVKLLLRLEEPVRGGLEESHFGLLIGPPELDCQVAALLALARAAHWGDPEMQISGAIRRALRGISLTSAHTDPSGRIQLLYDSLLLRQEVGSTMIDTGYWNFKLGLALRAFNAVRQMHDAGSLRLDQEARNHLEILDQFARMALRPSMRWENRQLEVLTSVKAGETNSETQPWVALGLFPAVERAIIGPAKAAPAAVAEEAPATSSERVVVYFDESGPPMQVEWECRGGQAGQLSERVVTTWESLGSVMPHWSVLTADQFLPANIEANEEDFFGSGEHDVEVFLATIRRMGRDPREFKVAHEFGCGLGRLTNHLATRFERVIACDASRPHLDIARARSWKIGRTNIDYRLARLPSFGMEEPFDLWFSIIVLQHNPPPIMALILRRALSLLRPGGLAVFQIPTYAPGYRFDISEYLASAVPPSGIEMHFLPQSAVFKVARGAGCAVLEVTHNGMTGDQRFLSNSMVIAKS